MTSSGVLRSQADTALTTIHAELLGQIDSKHAKIGDRVTLRTTSSWKVSCDVTVPIGAKLIGRVTQGKPHDRNHPDGIVVIMLESAEWKGAKSALMRIPIQAEINAIDPPSERPNEYALNAPLVGGWGETDSTRKDGASSNAASTVRSSTQLSGSIQDGTQARGKEAGTTSPGIVVNDGAGANLELAGTETIVGKASVIKGIFLAGDAPEVSSGTIFAKGKNLHLDGGTVFTLGLKLDASK
jgi:hypothetical protein